MTKQLLFSILCLIFVFGIVGCGTQAQNAEGLQTATPVPLIKYLTATVEPSLVVVTTAPTPTPPPLPTPTPYLYTVVELDTMIAIASRFGVTLDQLQAANPEVSPNFLSLGMQLVIPVSFDDQETVQEQVLPLEEGEVTCYSLRTGGMWCYWLIGNSLAEPVENIAGVIRLYNRAGDLVASENATTLLNVLDSGAQMPLAAFFPPGSDEWTLAQGQLISAVAVNQYAQRYASGAVEGLNVTVSDDGLGAEVTGTLRMEEDLDAEYIWVTAAAYDVDGTVVGVRRWEATAAPQNGVVRFAFEVFSLGRPIDSVEVFYEIRADRPADPE